MSTFHEEEPREGMVKAFEVIIKQFDEAIEEKSALINNINTVLMPSAPNRCVLMRIYSLHDFNYRSNLSFFCCLILLLTLTILPTFPLDAFNPSHGLSTTLVLPFSDDDISRNAKAVMDNGPVVMKADVLLMISIGRIVLSTINSVHSERFLKSVRLHLEPQHGDENSMYVELTTVSAAAKGRLLSQVNFIESMCHGPGSTFVRRT